MGKHDFLKFALGFIGILFSVKGHAFPDTIRHGYTNCTTCHISPAGGGLLTSYGRSLSSELMSTWGQEKEGRLLHGFAEIPEPLMEKFLVGGDMRYVSRKTESSRAKVDEGFLMQAQLRLGFVYEKIKLLLAAGKIEDPRQSQDVNLVSPEYYFVWSPKEEISFRFGRFEPTYGLRLPDHNLWIKSKLGFSPWLEKDSVEALYEGETQSLTLAGFQSTSAVNPTQQNTGYIVTFNQIVFDTSRIGFSGMNTEGQGTRAKALTLHGILSFSERFYTMLEQTRSWNGNATNDIGFVRIGYDVFKGFTPIFQYQRTQERNGGLPASSKTGFGLIWLPRPHFEIMGLTEKVITTQGDSNEQMLLLHYYL